MAIEIVYLVFKMLNLVYIFGLVYIGFGMVCLVFGVVYLVAGMVYLVFGVFGMVYLKWCIWYLEWCLLFLFLLLHFLSFPSSRMVPSVIEQKAPATTKNKSLSFLLFQHQPVCTLKAIFIQNKQTKNNLRAFLRPPLPNLRHLCTSNASINPNQQSQLESSITRFLHLASETGGTMRSDLTQTSRAL